MTTTPAETLTVQEILLGAAEHILTVGLHQDNWFADNTNWTTCRCCADGAMCVIAGWNPEAPGVDSDDAPGPLKAARELLAEHLVRLGWPEYETRGVPDPVQTIGHWNDADGMTDAEVAEILRDVAEQAA